MSDAQSTDRMRRILGLAHKNDKLASLIWTLQRSKREIRGALRVVPDRPTLGTNSAAAAVTTIEVAIKHLRRERGNVARALASSKPRRER